MPTENPEALRQAGRKWLEKKAESKLTLPNRLVLVPGLCNEDAGMWATVNKWGSEVFSNWQPVPITFPDPSTSTYMNFVDLGASTRDQIANALGAGQYDCLCYSMGGLDLFAALVNVAGGTGPSSQAQIDTPGTWVTFDTPFFGVENWQERENLDDMHDQSGTPIQSRRSQCEALAPTSPQLISLRNLRPQLAGRVQHMVCYCCESSDDVTMVGVNGDICHDLNPNEVSSPPTPWAPASPKYEVWDVPGATHAGAAAIYDNEWAISCAFADLTS